jgi:hypothetical protein
VGTGAARSATGATTTPAAAAAATNHPARIPDASPRAPLRLGIIRRPSSGPSPMPPHVTSGGRRILRDRWSRGESCKKR